jgi:hypothetical protein
MRERFGRADGRQAVWWAVALGGAAAALLAWRVPALYRSLPLQSPDSATYLAWDQMRPPLYPLVLSLVGLLDDTMALLGPVQYAALLAATAWLAQTFSAATGRHVLAAGLVLSIVGHPQVVSYCFTMLPEALLMAATMAYLAALIHLVHRPRPVWAATAGAMLAAAILLKPAALACSGGAALALLALWSHRQRSTLIRTFAAVALGPIVAVSAANAIRIGVFAPQVMGGFALLGVTSTFMPPDTPVEPPALQRALVAELTPLRLELARLDSLDLYYFYSSHAYHDALERSRDVILAHVGAPQQANRHGDEAFVQLNAIGARVARTTILHAPGAYLRHVTAHLYGLWAMPLVRRAGDRDAFAARLETAARELPAVASSPVAYRVVPDLAYWPYKAMLLLAFASSLVAIGGFLVRPNDPRWVAPALAGALVHGYFLLTAAAQTGLPRYAVTAWPLIATTVWGAAAAVLMRSSRASHRETTGA